MKQGLLGVLAGFVSYIFLCWALHGILEAAFPRQFHQDGTTDNFIINLVVALLSFDFSFVSGYINAIISKVNKLRYALIQAMIQLTLSVVLLSPYWELMPRWFHVIFLSFILPGVLGGAYYQMLNTDRIKNEK